MARKQTKIIATISDRCGSVEHLRALHEAGVDVVRLNTAHQAPEEALKLVQNVRAVSDKIAILVDTKGPEIRTAGITEKIAVKTGDRIFIGPADSAPDCPSFQTSYEALASDVPVGSKILIDDGSVEMTVEERRSGGLVCQANNAGYVANRKSINVPGVPIHLPSLTARDRDYVLFAVEHEIDFIAHSFVRNRDDVVAIQSILDTYQSPTKIIAKIENQEGVDNIEEILDAAYGVMVARGDLGVEVPLEQVPIIQKKLIRACIARSKPVITATQLLHSMIQNPRPTRAEASDVATAVFDGTDAVMLSGETACGEYPLQAVQAMAQIVRAVECETTPLIEHAQDGGFDRSSCFLARSATTGAMEMDARAIVCDTNLGYAARLLASYRCPVPIYACTHNRRVQRELAMSYGVYPFYIERSLAVDDMIRTELRHLVDQKELGLDDPVVFMAATPDKTVGANLLEFNTARSRLSVAAQL